MPKEKLKIELLDFSFKKNNFEHGKEGQNVAQPNQILENKW